MFDLLCFYFSFFKLIQGNFEKKSIEDFCHIKFHGKFAASPPRFYHKTRYAKCSSKLRRVYFECYYEYYTVTIPEYRTGSYFHVIHDDTGVLPHQEVALQESWQNTNSTVGYRAQYIKRTHHICLKASVRIKYRYFQLKPPRFMYSTVIFNFNAYSAQKSLHSLESLERDFCRICEPFRLLEGGQSAMYTILIPMQEVVFCCAAYSLHSSGKI